MYVCGDQQFFQLMRIPIQVIQKIYIYFFLTSFPDTCESSLVDTFSGPEAYLAMWTCYVDYYRRRASSSSAEDGGDKDETTSSSEEGKRAELLELFKRARNKLKMGGSGRGKGEGRDRFLEGNNIVEHCLSSQHRA